MEHTRNSTQSNAQNEANIYKMKKEFWRIDTTFGDISERKGKYDETKSLVNKKLSNWISPFKEFGYIPSFREFQTNLLPNLFSPFFYSVYGSFTPQL